MASESSKPGNGGGPASGKDLKQHPLVDRLKPDPAKPARKIVALIGLPGRSDRPGFQRLYLSAKLDYYAEFASADLIHSQPVPADASPIPGQEATHVTIARDATIHYVWAATPSALDEFDLDVRLGTPGAGMIPVLITRVATCFPDGTGCGTCNGTCEGTCGHQNTCLTCDTCHTRCQQVTCHTCQTQCAQNTCAGTCQTCQTQCGQNTCANTCQTCQTQCGQNTCATCNTCATQCGQPTCHTCATRCEQATCVTCHTCGDTCPHTCVTCIHPHCPLPQ